MIISPFTPLFFEPNKSDRLPSAYVQAFADTDVILVECICTHDEEPSFKIAREGDEEQRWRPIMFQSWAVNEEIKMCFARIRGLERGVFRLIDRVNGFESQPFRIAAESELKNTSLIQYSMVDNRSRSDAVFLIDGQRHFFSFRVPGGFKDTDWTFGVDAEQFTTSDGDLCTLYSKDSVQKKFTMGCADGVPVRFAELLNRLLTCTYVYIDGVRFARVGTSVPEMSEISSEIDSFVFKVNLQKVKNLDPKIERMNYVSIRRDYSTDKYMAENDNIILTE